MKRLANATKDLGGVQMPLGEISTANELENVCSLVCQVRGQEYKMLFPYLIHAKSFAWNMQATVWEYFRTLRKDYFPRPIKYVVDVGAHVGLWSVPFVGIFPGCRVLALEPSKYNFPFLERNIRGFPMIEAVKMAAGNAKMDNLTIAAPTVTQRMELAEIIDSGNISAWGKSPKYREVVSCDTLDNIVKERVDWIKMDIEGFEIFALEGAKELIQRDRPILQIEFNRFNLAMGNHSLGMLIDKIVGFKYWPAGEARGDIIWVPGPEE